MELFTPDLFLVLVLFFVAFVLPTLLLVILGFYIFKKFFKCLNDRDKNKENS